MSKQSKLERKETDEMLQQIELKRKNSAKYITDQEGTSEDDINIISNATSLPTVLPTLNEIETELDEDISSTTSISTTPPIIKQKDITSSTLNIAPDGSNGDTSNMEENDESSLITTSVSGMALTVTDDEEYTLMKYKYQNAPRIIAYDPQRKDAQSCSNKMFISFKLKLDNTSSKIKKKIKRRNSWSAVLKNQKCRQKKKKPDIVHKFLPIMLKLNILSAW
eukprot:UN08783